MLKRLSVLKDRIDNPSQITTPYLLAFGLPPGGGHTNYYGTNIEQRIMVYEQIREEIIEETTVEYSLLKERLQKELENNIPIRAKMLKEIFDESLFLPHFSFPLCKIIAEYEGGIESHLLGSTSSDSCPCCAMM